MKADEIQSLLEIFRRTLTEVNILRDLLQQESQALSDRLVDQIESVAEKKQESTIRIDQLVNVQRFFEQFDENDSAFNELRTYQEKIIKTLETCKALNERNGARVEIMSRYTRRAIDILRNPGNQQCTYGPDGSTQKITISRTRASV